MDKEHPSFIFEDVQLQMSVPAKFEHLPPLEEDGPADIVFKGGEIFTMDEKNPQVEALARERRTNTCCWKLCRD